VQLVAFDQLDQFTGILGVGGVTVFLQSVGPSYVVGGFEVEEGFVMVTLGDEEGVVFKGLIGGGVFTEAFEASVVLFIEEIALPVSAFDSEMVVPLYGQVAFSCA